MRYSKQGVWYYSQTESLPGKKSLSSSCYPGVSAPNSVKLRFPFLSFFKKIYLATLGLSRSIGQLSLWRVGSVVAETQDLGS